MRTARNRDDGILTCLTYALLAVFLMPVVGLFLICGKDSEKRKLGIVLLIISIILWIFIALYNT